MRLKVADQVHRVERRSEDSFEVDGVRVQVSVHAIGTGPPRFLGRTASGRRSIVVVREGERVFAQLDGRSYVLTAVSRTEVAAFDHSVTAGGLEAPMPGRVTRVNVAIGDTVVRGQELIVVEAMKMENALVAPSNGVVTSLAVAVGDMVTPGPVLVVIEAVP